MIINLDDVEAQLRSQGLVLDKALSFDARIQRWKVEGEDNEKRGWSRLKEWTSSKGITYVVGSYGVWHGTDDGYTKIEITKDEIKAALSNEDKAAMRAAQKASAEAIKRERKIEADTAARWAALVWAAATPISAQAEHEYLVRKQIQPHNVRLLGDSAGLSLPGIDDSNFYRLKIAAGALVVPMHDADGNVCGVQFIYPMGHPRKAKIERDKEFWPAGMGMGGTFGVIGPINRSGILLIAEGYATAASLHEATGQSVAYAFSANNLIKAGKALRKAYTQLRLLFCCDDDYLTPGNPGVTAGSAASAEIERSAWCKPDFLDAEGNDRRAGKKLTDFNDLVMLTGLTLPAANQINAALDANKWREKPSAAAPASGGASGASLTEGGGEGARRQAVSVMSLDEIVNRFINIDDDTGDFVFDTWTKSVCKRSKMVGMLPAGMSRDDVKRHPVWLARSVYIDQIGFDPSGEDSGVVCNRWGGWPTKPKAGCCDVLLDLLRYLCSREGNSDELYQWMLRWLAYPIQHPGAKMHSAVVVHGPQGTGKSRFFEAYAKIFGEYSVILNQGAIEDKFNADWSERKLFVLADEIVANSEKHHLKNQLKNFITSDWVRINPKNVAAHKERNHMNMVFLSNEIQPLVLENDDRRHCVIWTPAKLSDDFYLDVTQEIANGGIEALHQYLLDLDLGDFKPWTRPPMTDAKRNLVLVGAGSTERFIADWMAGFLDIPFCPIGVSTLYAEYQAYWKREGFPWGDRSPIFWGHFRKLGWRVGVTDRLDDASSTRTVSWRCLIPDATALSSAAQRGLADHREPPDGKRALWLYQCWFAVDQAIKNREGGLRRVA